MYKFSDRSTTRPKTFDPVWNEQFVHDVINAKNINLTVFHDAALPPDDFVANCIIPLEDIMQHESNVPDLWVNLEPQGKIHVVIELKNKNGKYFLNIYIHIYIYMYIYRRYHVFFIYFTDTAKDTTEVDHAISSGAGANKEFKERAGFNRRRGAMRRRVHQVNARCLRKCI